jgi:hypothetical protein
MRGERELLDDEAISFAYGEKASKRQLPRISRTGRRDIAELPAFTTAR